MSESKKYKVTVWLPKACPVHPTIEAKDLVEARRIAKTQYSDAKSIGAIRKVKD